MALKTAELAPGDLAFQPPGAYMGDGLLVIGSDRRLTISFGAVCYRMLELEFRTGRVDITEFSPTNDAYERASLTNDQEE